MIVRYGRSVPRGFLPVFSTDTEEEARQLLTLMCPVNQDGEFVAPELTRAQTLENLQTFSDRLQTGWEIMHRPRRGPAGG